MLKEQLMQFSELLRQFNSDLINADSQIRQLHYDLVNRLHYRSQITTDKRLGLMKTWEQLMASLQEGLEEGEDNSNAS